MKWRQALGVSGNSDFCGKSRGTRIDPTCDPCGKISGKTVGDRFLPEGRRHTQGNPCGDAFDRRSCGKSEIPIRFAASKVMEGDNKDIRRLNLTENEKHLLEDISRQTKKKRVWTVQQQLHRCGLPTLKMSAMSLDQTRRK